MVTQSIRLSEEEVFGAMVRQHARAAESKATLRERSVINTVFSSKSERLWELGDALLALLPGGAWVDRARVVREIEGELGGVR